jgi:hypothetical protein
MSLDSIAVIAAVGAPLVELLYAIGEHLSWWDRLSGRGKALQGFERLRTPTGYPKGWIYNDEEDRQVFRALEKRLRKTITSDKLAATLSEGHAPSLITMGGDPFLLTGIPADWPAEEKRVYTSEHPVMMIFGVSREGGQGKGERACSLGELESQLDLERTRREFWAGSLAIALLGVALALVGILLAVPPSAG